MIRILKLLSPLIIIWLGSWIYYYTGASNKVWYGLPIFMTNGILIITSVFIMVDEIAKMVKEPKDETI